jgi:opacity protein-like surface antigen
MIRRLVIGLAMGVVLAAATGAGAFEAAQTFQPGSFVISAEAGYGEQVNTEDRHLFTGLELMNAGIRFGFLPFGPVGPGPLRGSLEVGLEPLYQRYLDPVDAFFAGLGATFRYHFLALGRFVPYAEVAGFAGGTDLRTPEIDSDFTFLVWGGVGASFFVTDRAAIYGGYRYQHVSNGNTERPNRGFESHTGVVGVSFFFQ